MWGDVSLIIMEDEIEGELIETETEGNSPGSQNHSRGYSVMDEVLEPLKNDGRQDTVYQMGFLGFTCAVV